MCVNGRLPIDFSDCCFVAQVLAEMTDTFQPLLDGVLSNKDNWQALADNKSPPCKDPELSVVGVVINLFALKK